ncbi:MAG: hypothetical protein JW757_04245 [Anaerolineales bacterium]|nr:hypothetical protein [Anaerolineales bacterium]
MEPEFNTYRSEKFPIIFSYPSYARYKIYHQTKHSKQVMVKEEKERYGKNESGKTVFIYPKLCITVLRVYVPGYQTKERKAYFMSFDDYLNKLIDLKHKKLAFPEMIIENITIANFWEGVKTIYRHPNNVYWRTEIYLMEIEDDTNIVNIMYRHIGDKRSDEELGVILGSLEQIT